MITDALTLRAHGDTELFTQLLGEYEVKRCVEAIARAGESHARRSLLATMLRLSPKVAPETYALVERCAKTLGLTTPFELYIYPDTSFNAGCMKPERGRVMVLFSSALYEAFDADELAFVVGHELGHHLYGHHDLPSHALLAGDHAVGGALALRVFAWSRMAEISADRAGFVCGGSLDVATRALWKLASGLRTSGKVRVDVEDLVTQATEIQLEDAGAGRAGEASRHDWFDTHPFSPLRVKALQLFAGSDLVVEGGMARAQLESEIAALLAIMDPSYLTEKSDAAEAMRRLLFAAGVLVADATEGISEAEVKALEKLLGPGAVENARPAALREDLPRRISAVNEEVPPLRRAQLIRDLCVIALADGRVAPEEERVVQDVAAAIGVDAALVTRSLAAPPRLD